MLLLLTGCTLFIEPEAGTYMANVQDFEADPSCAAVWGVDVESLARFNATDVALSEDGEMMTLDNIPCERFGLMFTCVQAGEEKVPGFDATIQSRVTVDGEWVSSYAFDSNWELLATCLGGGCEEYTERCLISWTFDADFVD